MSGQRVGTNILFFLLILLVINFTKRMFIPSISLPTSCYLIGYISFPDFRSFRWLFKFQYIFYIIWRPGQLISSTYAEFRSGKFTLSIESDNHATTAVYKLIRLPCDHSCLPKKPVCVSSQSGTWSCDSKICYLALGQILLKADGKLISSQNSRSPNGTDWQFRTHRIKHFLTQSIAMATRSSNNHFQTVLKWIYPGHVG